jgi:hypothetical protein
MLGSLLETDVVKISSVYILAMSIYQVELGKSFVTKSCQALLSLKYFAEVFTFRVPMQCSRYVTFRYGSAPLIADFGFSPDPDPPSVANKMTKNLIFFSQFFSIVLTVGTYTSAS